MNSIGWASNNRANKAAAYVKSPSIDPNQYNKNYLKSNNQYTPPPISISENYNRLPLTEKNMAGMDKYGHKTAYIGQPALINPREFNATYLTGSSTLIEPKLQFPSDAYSKLVFDQHFGQPENLGALIKGLPVAQAKQLEDAAKSAATKKKWSDIADQLQNLETARKAKNITPAQSEMAQQITDVVHSGMMKLNLGGNLDPDNFKLTYIEPDPLGPDTVYEQKESQTDDRLTRVRKRAKKAILAEFPNNAKLRRDAQEIFENILNTGINTDEYKKLTPREKVKYQIKIVDTMTSNIKVRDFFRSQGIISKFLEPDKKYIDDFKERKKGEDAKNKDG